MHSSVLTCELLLLFSNLQTIITSPKQPTAYTMHLEVEALVAYFKSVYAFLLSNLFKPIEHISHTYPESHNIQMVFQD